MSSDKPKYKVGDYVVLDKVFTPVLTASGKNYDTSIGEIMVKVVRVQKSVSLGYCYQLESPDGINLGGVMYWESDIVRQCLSPDDSELEFWKMWGDI